MTKRVLDLKEFTYVISKYTNFFKTRLKMKHDIRGTNSLLWTFRGTNGLLGGTQEVKEGLTEIGIFVLI